MSVLLTALALGICPPSGVRISCVHDGDTFIMNREGIRIMDIDTPELNGNARASAGLRFMPRSVADAARWTRVRGASEGGTAMVERLRS